MKLGRTLILAAAGLILIAAAAYFAAQRYLGDLIVHEIEARSGLKASIHSAALRFVPRIGVATRGVMLANPDGSPLLTIGEADFDLSAAALMAGKLQLAEIILQRPVMRVTEMPATAGTATAPKFDIGRLSFAGPVKVHDGVLIDDNRRRHVETWIDKIELSAARDTDGSFALILSGNVEGYYLRIAGSIASFADFWAAKATGFAGTVAMGAPDAQPRAVQARLRLAPAGLEFDNVHAQWTRGARAQSLSAAGEFRWDGAAPKLVAHVDADALDLGIPGQDDFGKGNGNAIDALSNQTIDFRALRAIDAAIDVTARDLVLGRLHFGHAALTARLDDGRSAITLAASNFYSGRAAVRFDFDAAQRLPTQALKAKFTGVDTSALLKDLTGSANIGGMLDFAADLSANGTSPRMIVRNTAGTANLKFTNGVIVGVNLPETFRTVSQYLPKAWQDLNDQIPVTALTGNFQLAGGQAATDDLHLVSPALDVTGKGTIDLAGRRFDLRFEPKLVQAGTPESRKPVSPLDLGAAILVRGPWRNPQITADLSGMMENPQATMDKLKGLGQQFLGDKKSGKAIMKGLGDLLQGFGGGK